MAHLGARSPLPYVAAFDGLRAFAVLAVVAYHASLDGAPGGFFGVDVFFVISGYLVTALLLARALPAWPGGPPIPDGEQTLDFWRRRLLRLVPAALATVALTWAAFAALEVRSPATLAGEALSSLGYFANWFFLLRDQSYFETLSTPSPFLHFWSLAVEAQFYLAWPVLLIAALRFGGRLAAFALAVSLAAISTLVVASLYSPTADPSRAYFGTDARVAGLLLGAALAIVLRPAAAARIPRVPVEVSGWAGLAIITWFVTTVSEFDPFIYRGGFFLVSSATLAVLLAALHGRNTVARVLSIQPLRWLGERSYSIYLWHWPIFVLTQPQLGNDLSLSLLLARLGATVVLVEISYRLVEHRFRHGAPVWRLPRIELGKGPYLQRPWARPAGVVAVGLLAVAVAGGLPIRAGLANDLEAIAGQISSAGTGSTESVAMAPGTRPPLAGPVSPALSHPADTSGAPSWTATPHATRSDPPAGAPSPGSPPATSPLDTSPRSTGGASDRDGRADGGVAPTDDLPDAGLISSGSSASSGTGAGGEAVTPSATPDPAPLGASVTVLGDSVALGAADSLQQALPGAVVDAEVGRQFWSAPAVIEELAAAGALGDIVVIHLGANGPFTGEQFEAVIDALGGRTVLFVTITVPRRWETEVNEALANRAQELPGTALIDWHGASAGTVEYFAGDGVHLTATGRDAYAALIAEAVSRAIAEQR